MVCFSLYPGQLVMWPVGRSALLWLLKPGNHGTGTSGGLHSDRHCTAACVRIRWASKDFHDTIVLKALFFWVDANPPTVNNSSFWQQWAGSGPAYCTRVKPEVQGPNPAFCQFQSGLQIQFNCQLLYRMSPAKNNSWYKVNTQCETGSESWVLKYTDRNVEM